MLSTNKISLRSLALFIACFSVVGLLGGYFVRDMLDGELESDSGFILFSISFMLALGIWTLMDRVNDAVARGSVEERTRESEAQHVRVESTYGSAIVQLQDRERMMAREDDILRALVDAIPMGVILVRSDSDTVVRTNPLAEALLQKSSLFETRFYHPGGGEVPYEVLPYAVAKASRQTNSRSDLVIKFPQDGFRFLSMSARILEGPAVSGYILVTIYDITEYKEAEKAKSDFVSLASHQLRTPVATINWYAELLLGEGLDGLSIDQRANIQQISESSRRLSRLVTALLDTSRVELGTLHHDEGFFDPVQLLTQVLAELRPMAVRKRVRLHEDVDPSVPMVACGSKIGMIIFENILSNALKYTPEKGEIHCSLRTSKDARGFDFVVEDSGIGIPLDEAQYIFARFYRTRNAKEVDATGSGLGLSITRTLIERSGGRISFRPRPGGGTIFSIYVPFACAI